MKAMDALEQSQPLTLAILDSLDDPVLVVDSSGDLRHVGRGAVELLGDLPLGAPVWTVIPACDRLAVEQAIQSALSTSPIWVDARLIAASGAWVPVKVTARRYREAGVASGYVIAAVRGDTRGGDASGEEDEATAALIGMVQSVFTLNHDIRNPLGAILGNAQLMQRALAGGDAKVLDRLDRVVQLCGRIGGLLDEMTEAKQALLAAAPQLESRLRPPPKA